MLLLREINQMRDHWGVGRTANHICESVSRREIPPTDISLASVYQSFFGHEAFEALNPRYAGSSSPVGIISQLAETYSAAVNPSHPAHQLAEANLNAAGGAGFGSAVASAAFSNITGQIIYNSVLEGYQMEELIGDQLVTTVDTPFNGEKIAGIGHMGDQAGVVEENGEYPRAGLQEEWIETPETTKRGLICEVTKEAIYFDRVQQVAERARQTGEWLGINKEKRILRGVVGLENTYKRNGIGSNTYIPTPGVGLTAPYINEQVNPLVDFNSVENAENLFYKVRDPNTGEPISIRPDAMLVPFLLRYTAHNILYSTGIVTVDNQPNASTLRTMSPNPLNDAAVMKGLFKPLYSRFLEDAMRSVDATNQTWWFGNFKKAFMYMQNWPITTVQAPANNEVEFTRDVVLRWKSSERGTFANRDPRYAQRNKAA